MSEPIAWNSFQTDAPGGVFAEVITFPGGGGDDIHAYVARPVGQDTTPGIVVVHQSTDQLGVPGLAGEEVGVGVDHAAAPTSFGKSGAIARTRAPDPSTPNARCSLPAAPSDHTALAALNGNGVAPTHCSIPDKGISG